MLITSDSLRELQIGELLTVVVVKAANAAKDIRENLRNLSGGRMTHYEKLIQDAVDTALQELEAKSKEKGYEGIVGLKISNPVVVNGGVEIVVYGNGYNKADKDSPLESEIASEGGMVTPH